MTASPLHPIVIWFGRVGDMILLSALLDVLAARYGGGCHVIGAGSWPGEIYATHSAVARVSALHRYTAWVFDPAWWRTARALRAARAEPVYVCETDPRKLARIRRLLAASGTDPRRCLILAAEPAEACSHWVDRLVSLGRLTPPAFDAAAYPWPSEAPPGAPRLEVSAAAQADCDAWLEDKGWRERPLVLMFGAHSQRQWLPRSACGSQVLGVGGPPHSRRLDEISVETVFSAWCALGAQPLAATRAAPRAPPTLRPCSCGPDSA